MLRVSLSEKGKCVCVCVWEGVVKRELSHTCFPPIAGKPSLQHQVHVEFCYAALAFGPSAAKPISPSWRWLHRGDAHADICLHACTDAQTHRGNGGASQTVHKWCSKPGISHRGKINHILQINHIFRKGLPGNIKHSEHIRNIKAG